jgi:hypothetical protein
MPSSIAISRTRRIVLTLALAAAAAIGVSATASAAIFSPYVPPQTATLGDCRIYLGPVYTSAPPYKVVGGFQINCSLRHSYIYATVSEGYAQDSVHWWQGGYATSYSYNTTGYGSWIQTTPGFCAVHNMGLWYTSATVTISGVGTQTWYSTPRYALGACST